MKLVRSRADFFAARETLARPVALVPTMGALHAGHTALLAAAREAAESVVATVFVNPLQFTPSEDLDRYPRTLDDDLARCEAAGADVVWAPSVADVYPGGDALVRIDPGPLGARLEGAARPGHFAGMLTVVAKFFGLVRPAVAFFGEKDYQQLILVRRMATDLEQFVAVAGVPTVRADDGLALSSRNRYLAPAERTQALALARALVAGQAAAGNHTFGRGGRPGASPGGPEAVLAAARAVLAAAPAVAVDYLELTDPDLGPAPGHGPARLLLAARIGATRLIDNVPVELG